jgi:hypothetical protein
MNKKKITIMSILNVFDIKIGAKKIFQASFIEPPKSAIEGVCVCICDNEYGSAKYGKNWEPIWEDILKRSGGSDGQTYIIGAMWGGAGNLVYVGKTLNSLAKRYPKGPTGGLELVFEAYLAKPEKMICVLYNTSHPGLVEGWCYQILLDKKYNLANQQDPSLQDILLKK